MPSTFFEKIKRFITTKHGLLVSGVILALVLLMGGLGFLGNPQGKAERDAARLTALTTLRDDDWVRNDPKTAKAVLIEYSDFECPACGVYHGILKQLEADTKSDIAIVYRHFPLSAIHPNATLASRAAEAAGVQGKFFEMHDELFMNQKEWARAENPRDVITGYAQKLELNEEQFVRDLDSKEIMQKITGAEKFARDSGLKGTPSFFLNGVEIPPARTYAEFKNNVISHTYTE